MKNWIEFAWENSKLLQKFTWPHGTVQWQEAGRAEEPLAVNNDEVPKGMWGKQEGFILSGSLWVLISQGQGEQKMLNGNWPVSACSTSTWRGSCSSLSVSSELPHYWLMSTEPWLLIWYLGPSKWQNLRRMMDYMGREGMRILATVSFFPRE